VVDYSFIGRRLVRDKIELIFEALNEGFASPRQNLKFMTIRER
jgi:hypothetical protein